MSLFTFADEAALTRFAGDFALALRVGDCIALHGDLGAGKTTFSRAVIRALSADFSGTLDVPSPTYTLVQQYDCALPVSHFDLYRITDPDELEELGLDAALENGVALIEWPERGGTHLPSDCVNLSLQEPDSDPDARTMSITGPDDFIERLEHSLAVRTFLAESGHASSHRVAFPGDASTRTYEFIHGGADQPVILMDAPRMPDGPAIYDGLPYSQVVHLAEDVRPFVAISSLLISKGFCAPAIFAHDLDAGLLLLENLGSDKIVDDNNRPISDRYIAVAETLAKVHDITWPKTIALPDGSSHTIPRYDVRAMRTGLSLLPDWWGKENGLSGDQVEALYALWTPVFERFQNGYDDLIIRDYHSPNIIWRGEKTGSDRIGIIDHQDALIGPGVYDLASLTQDARTIVPHELQQAMMDAYCAARRTKFDEAQLREDTATLCAFRNSRLLGLWVRLDVRDNKPRFRGYVNQTKTYLSQALSHPALADLRAWYQQAGIIDG